MKIWQSAMEIAEVIHMNTNSLPKKEDYGFTSQIRRAALSISANIAEAFGRHHILDKINFYYMARGSITETQSHLEYGHRVGYFDEQFTAETDEKLGRLHEGLNKLISTLKTKAS